MLKYYAKPEYFDEKPEVLTPTPQQLEAGKTVSLAFVGSTKKSYDEIEDYLLVTQGYAVSYGATGNHVRQILSELVADSLLKETSSGFFYVPEE